MRRVPGAAALAVFAVAGAALAACGNGTGVPRLSRAAGTASPAPATAARTARSSASVPGGVDLTPRAAPTPDDSDEGVIRACLPGLPETAEAAAEMLDGCLNRGEGGFAVAPVEGTLPVVLAGHVYEPGNCWSAGYVLWRTDRDWRIQWLTPLLPDWIDTHLLGALREPGVRRLAPTDIARQAVDGGQTLMTVLAEGASCGSGPFTAPLLFRLAGDRWELAWDPRGTQITQLSDAYSRFVTGEDEIDVSGALWMGLAGSVGPAIFSESHPGPHRYEDQTWVRKGDGYVFLDSRIEPSAYETLYNFIFAISRGEETAAANKFVTDPALVDRAIGLGLKQQPLGQGWMLTTFDGHTECCGPIAFSARRAGADGALQTVVVSFVQRGEAWLISSIATQ